MSWIGQDIELRGVRYAISYRVTFSKPGGGGELYAASAAGATIYLGLLSPGGETLTPAEAEHIQGLSQEGYLPVRALDRWQGQPVFIFGAVQLTPLDQARRESDWSQQWVVEQMERLALAIDRCHERLDSAARVQLGRIIVVEPGRNLLLMPPLRLNRTAAAKAEDIRQLALVAAWLFTGAWLAPEALSAASNLTPAARTILTDACYSQYRLAADFARALATTLRSPVAAASSVESVSARPPVVPAITAPPPVVMAPLAARGDVPTERSRETRRLDAAPQTAPPSPLPWSPVPRETATRSLSPDEARTLPVLSATPLSLPGKPKATGRFLLWLLSFAVLLLVGGAILAGRAFWLAFMAESTPGSVAMSATATMTGTPAVAQPAFTSTVTPVTNSPTPQTTLATRSPDSITPTRRAEIAAPTRVADTPTTTQTANTPTAVPQLTKTPTARPPAPTATYMPSPTKTATARPPTATVTYMAPPTQPLPVPPAHSYPAPALLTPAADLTASGATTFAWRWDGPALATNQAFEVRLWKEDQPDHYGAAEPVNGTSAIINVREAYGVQRGGNGRYFWTVAVVQRSPYQRIGPEADPRPIAVNVGSLPTIAPPR